MSLKWFIDSLTASDTLGGRLFKTTTLGGVDSADDYTLSDPAGGRRIKVSVTSASGGSGLFLDGGSMSATLRSVEDAAGTNSPLQLSTAIIGVASAIQHDWVSTPTGAANKTTTWFDATGRMSWRPGTGASSFIRTFDATGITADRSWVLPDASTTLAGLSVAQTFTQAQNINANLYVGHTGSASARVHVRGDGTNDISRFENTSAIPVFRVGTGSSNSAQATVGAGLYLYSRFTDGDISNSASLIGINAGYQSAHQNDWAVSSHYFTSSSRVFNNTSVVTGTAGNARFVQSFAIQNANSSAINYRSLAVEYTINNTVASTGTATGIFLNATETALNGMTHNLMDLQVGGSSRFRVANDGSVSAVGSVTSSDFIQSNQASPFRFGSSRSRMYSDSDGTIRFSNAAQTSFTSLLFTVAASTNIGVYMGSGTPESVVTANVGSLYLRTNGGAGTTLYVKESGTGNTGWVAK